MVAVSTAKTARLPLTPLGRLLSSLGLNLPSINYGVRQASARVLQVLILVGLLAVLLARRKRIHPLPEFYYLGVASLSVVVLQVLLPPLSLNYGLLRSFEQALVILGVYNRAIPEQQARTFDFPGTWKNLTCIT